MIVEGIVTTRDSNGAIHVAPMGPIVDESLSKLRLRPFKTSQTYANLKRTPFGVFHVIDDVLLLARSAVGLLAQTPPTFPASRPTAERAKSSTSSITWNTPNGVRFRLADVCDVLKGRQRSCESDSSTIGPIGATWIAPLLSRVVTIPSTIITAV